MSKRNKKKDNKRKLKPNQVKVEEEVNVLTTTEKVFCINSKDNIGKLLFGPGIYIYIYTYSIYIYIYYIIYT